MVNTLNLLLINSIASSISLICTISILYYGGRVFEHRGKPKFRYYLTYLAYFIISGFLSIGNHLTLNFGVLWGTGVEYHQTLSLIYLMTLGLTSISFLILAIILKVESEHPSKYRKWMLYGQIFFGIVIVGIIGLTSIKVAEFQNDLPTFTYMPSFTLLLLLVYTLIIGLGYGLQSIIHYFQNIQKLKISQPTPFHYLYLFIAAISFVIISLTVLYRVLLPTTADERALITNLIIIVFILLPTLRWLYLEQFEKAMYRLERNKLLDTISHDLTNVTQIILSLIEFLLMDPQLIPHRVELEVLLQQIERMGALLAEARSFIQEADN